MEAVGYSSWSETAHTVHMVLQMMGKVKLDRMSFQPEWNHALLDSTAEGFTTGLVPDGQSAFSLSLNVVKGSVSAQCTTGQGAGFLVESGMSVAGIYAELQKMLRQVGHPVSIDATPQECANTTPFHEQHKKLRYDTEMARNFFDCTVLAYSALLDFAAPLRCKKILPSMFWGTFDMTTVLFSGEAEPFAGKGVINQVAFDEKLVEFGFWPGDEGFDEPGFFSLAYPFITTRPGAVLHTEGAYYSKEKMEYLLPLKAVLAAADPVRAIQDFCRDTFAVAVKENQWKRIDWITKPLAR